MSEAVVKDQTHGKSMWVVLHRGEVLARAVKWERAYAVAARHNKTHREQVARGESAEND